MPCDKRKGKRPRLGVSACLLGLKVRWDGRHKLDRYVRDVLARHFELVAVCPEHECGLPIPREPIHLEADPARPRLVTVNTGVDLTARMQAWIDKRLDQLTGLELCGFVLKSKSPSCGLKVKVFSNGKICGFASGLFAAALAARFAWLPLAEETDLRNPTAKARFMDRLCRRTQPSAPTDQL